MAGHNVATYTLSQRAPIVAPVYNLTVCAQPPSTANRRGMGAPGANRHQSPPAPTQPPAPNRQAPTAEVTLGAPIGTRRPAPQPSFLHPTSKSGAPRRNKTARANHHPPCPDPTASTKLPSTAAEEAWVHTSPLAQHGRPHPTASPSRHWGCHFANRHPPPCVSA